MDIKKLIEESKDKPLIVIQSRLREEDISAFLGELDEFNTIDLPILYTGDASKGEFKQWRKLDN